MGEYIQMGTTAVLTKGLKLGGLSPASGSPVGSERN